MVDIIKIMEKMKLVMNGNLIMAICYILFFACLAFYGEGSLPLRYNAKVFIFDFVVFKSFREICSICFPFPLCPSGLVCSNNKKQGAQIHERRPHKGVSI